MPAASIPVNALRTGMYFCTGLCISVLFDLTLCDVDSYQRSFALALIYESVGYEVHDSKHQFYVYQAKNYMYAMSEYEAFSENWIDYHP